MSVTLALSAVILGLVGILLIDRVTTGLLQAKETASVSEATAATQEVQRLLNASDTAIGAPNATRLVDSVITALAIRSGTPGLFDALFLGNPTLVGQPERGTALISENSVPLELRTAIRERQLQAWQYSLITYEDGTSVPGIVIGSPVNVPSVGAYELYLMFPLNNERDSVNLVQRAIVITGLLLLFGIAVLVWFVAARVTEPVRETALVAQSLASGDLDRRVVVKGEDDLAILGTAFNDMATSLQNQIVRLETLSTVQQQFVSDVSHELRTPLTTVRMASEMIYDARDKFDTDTARSAELLRNQVDRFDALLSDLLEISRFDAGAAELEVVPVDVSALVSGCISAHEEIAKTHNCSIDSAIETEPIFIYADSRRINRIVRNLMVNAIEHSGGKPIRVTVASNETAVSIGVRDFGNGLDPLDVEKVFSRFWRADPARKRTLGGTGLGLAISLDDAKLHGGTIQVWGEPRKGAHFVLTLPFTQDQTFSSPAIDVQEGGHSDEES
ncbi:MAG: HAMP domain-containing protein [Actinobacteria bacterium]|uniref:Sensor histidine kinase MtrB n=1 Tax=freshwater metagenome TaxID=449393 RepID=A0A6J5ZPA3_9ZZZZ|nr:HAMP domain-containing protein [Actinomycetota bacterium]